MSLPQTLDVGFLGRSEVIAAALVDCAEGCVVVDPGPASSVPGLIRALAQAGRSLDDIRAILITHIHLDHSGATGTLLESRPDIDVFVHERGAPHLIDPGKLLGSAGRLYGDQMQSLWGAVKPVPANRVTALSGGETLEIGGERFEVRYTPGHASHHVSYLHVPSGTAFVGDTGGIRIGQALFVVAPTPPPDIDVEIWLETIERIAEWRPVRLALTHFGMVSDPVPHLEELKRRLVDQASVVRHSLQTEGDDERRIAAFREAVMRSLREVVGDDEGAVERLRLAVPFDHCWMGLARYWRQREPALRA